MALGISTSGNCERRICQGLSGLLDGIRPRKRSEFEFICALVHIDKDSHQDPFETTKTTFREIHKLHDKADDYVAEVSLRSLPAFTLRRLSLYLRLATRRRLVHPIGPRVAPRPPVLQHFGSRSPLALRCFG